MFTHTQTQSLLGTIGTWWRNWRHARATAWEIEGLAEPELARVAQDVGLNVPQLRTLAGKWPDAADLLSQRLEALRLDEITIARAEPGVVRDLQRVCSTCSDQRRCNRDIDKHPSDRVWRDYCPNVATIDALRSEDRDRRLLRRSRKWRSF
jgi:hypothetical protein